MSIPEYPINPTEQYLNRMVTGEGELPPHPITRTHQYLKAMTGTLADLKSAISEVAEEPTVTTMTLEAGKTYDFGEAAELTLTVGDGHYHFAFTSPAGTPTVLTVTGHTAECDDNDTIEAGKRYECDIWAGVLLLKNMDATEVVSGT